MYSHRSVKAVLSTLLARGRVTSLIDVKKGVAGISSGSIGEGRDAVCWDEIHSVYTYNNINRYFDSSAFR